ncbi:MAG TPA: DUF721 domain-containing protein [Chitinophagales bacterium]|nr:DUF721 domain-containing protein [Chitinophagales bacterium]HNE45171.1 DUF721 domain-containing protein [Chitinophagales bacterium]HNK99360.1 DUF721 domain-containing protein [Chitinophagales bacterium]
MKKDNQLSIGDAIKQLFHSIRIEDKVAEVRIKELWPTMMGAAIHRYTGEIYFNKGILTIYINSAPLKQDLQFSKQEIIERVNEELQENLVREVIIR